MVFIHADLMIIYFVSDLSQYYMTMAALCLLTSPNFCSMCQDPVGEQIYVFCSSSMTSVWKYFPIHMAIIISPTIRFVRETLFK